MLKGKNKETVPVQKGDHPTSKIQEAVKETIVNENAGSGYKMATKYCGHDVRITCGYNIS